MTPKCLFAAILLITSTAFADGIVKRGVAIPADAERVPLAAVLATPRTFAGRAIATEGKVEKVCFFAGCWMKVTPEIGQPGMRVTFAKGAFVVPRGSAGQRARLFGTVKVDEGKASFVASGVELAQASRK